MTLSVSCGTDVGITYLICQSGLQTVNYYLFLVVMAASPWLDGWLPFMYRRHLRGHISVTISIIRLPIFCIFVITSEGAQRPKLVFLRLREKYKYERPACRP